jgi:hypothetical protein
MCFLFHSKEYSLFLIRKMVVSRETCFQMKLFYASTYNAKGTQTAWLNQPIINVEYAIGVKLCAGT